MDIPLQVRRSHSSVEPTRHKCVSPQSGITHETYVD